RVSGAGWRPRPGGGRRRRARRRSPARAGRAPPAPPRRGAPDRSSWSALEGPVLVHGLALDQRQEDAGVADRTRIGPEDVPVEDRQIRQLAHLDGAGRWVEMIDPGAADREG